MLPKQRTTLKQKNSPVNADSDSGYTWFNQTADYYIDQFSYDNQFEEIKTSDGGFERFVSNHNHSSMVIEDNEAMTGSYLLIDPQGRLFENSEGKHTYSSPLQSNNIEKCLSEINLNEEMFIKRGGIYEW